MKFAVEYIPISKIKSDQSSKMTDHIKKFHIVMLDCMHLMVVRKNKDGHYTVLSGLSRFEYLRTHADKKYVPCIVDRRKGLTAKALVNHLNNKFYSDENSIVQSWSIIKSFISKEPHFNRLSLAQQLKVIFLGIRYKRTVISAMKNKVNYYRE
ncbi:hypothetical protein [Aquibacillus saliphilus]|uniref:hypothetical protein n=1 Tax=Aquibacillus saliphilus TaxID=1909422 RepID=UPI001CF08447|nr:hypothetical protein [Aquibacillus saliphilus]